ncbi:MAG: GTPase HflX [Gammaproteobacteria bacterium]|nr:GTPase HflX [Gammaproteobacteria bacterium]
MTSISDHAVLVYCAAGAGGIDNDHEEFASLAHAANVTVAGSIDSRRLKPDAHAFIGRGKILELAARVAETNAGLVLIDAELSPAQERNLERLVGCRVLDRTGLILDIFAQRARSFEGRLEVERAQLRYLSTRLVRGWTHLERQKGGIGLRGPGESQLETDRRLIGKRITYLTRRLERVQRQRVQGREQRRRTATPVVALVGYTNAGKTTLFNALTGDSAVAADRLFATLDPLLRRISVPGIGPAVVADTVGFVSRLPHELIEAFRATLTEARDADVLVHVIDSAAGERDARIEIVNQVLEEIGAGGLPQIEVYNKCDLIDAALGLHPRSDEGPERVYVSAREGRGLEALRESIARLLGVVHKPLRLRLAPGAGRLRARLFELGAVTGETQRPEGGWVMDVRLRESALDRLLQELAPEESGNVAVC